MTEKQKAMAATAKRTEIERRAVAAIHRKIVETFERIVELGYGEHLQAEMFRLSRINNKEELEKALNELRMYLYMVAENSSVQAADIIKDNYGNIVPLAITTYLNREANGKTPKQRLAIYTNRLKMEMESWITAGLLLKMGEKSLVSAFNGQSEHPYHNDVFDAARAKNTAVAATRLRTGGVSYGIGQYVSAESYIKRLERFMIADSFRLAQFLTFGSMDGVIGYHVGRGSSYPCSLCDSMTGFHPKGFEELPPYHANCCCWAMPVFQSVSVSESINLS